MLFSMQTGSNAHLSAALETKVASLSLVKKVKWSVEVGSFCLQTLQWIVALASVCSAVSTYNPSSHSTAFYLKISIAKTKTE